MAMSMPTPVLVRVSMSPHARLCLCLCPRLCLCLCPRLGMPSAAAVEPQHSRPDAAAETVARVEATCRFVALLIEAGFDFDG